MSPPDQEPLEKAAGKPEHIGVMIGLCAISASTLIVEICLTKFLGCKIFHHLSYAVLSMVILSFGASGAFVYMLPRLFPGSGGEAWRPAWKAAALYAIFLGLAIPFFCWFPWDPYIRELDATKRFLAQPIYFLTFSIPMFLAGLCISQTLSASRRSVARIYFFDLLAAAIGASLCPILLIAVGGYGTIAISCLLGVIASVAFFLAASAESAEPDSSISESAAAESAAIKVSPTKNSFGSAIPYWVAAAGAVVVLLLYPDWAIKQFGFDIRSSKDWGQIVFVKEFGGIRSTHWNAIARVDVSKTATSKNRQYRYGLAPDSYKKDIYGRYVLLDGGANTRQFKIDGSIAQETYLGDALWASPYVAEGNAAHSLVIGGGGGIDILIAKFFKTKDVDVAEVNPSIYDLLTGKIDDQEKEYSPWLQSDANSKINIFLSEARHFCTTRPDNTYDIIQASGVDTLTAITTGGMSLVENYLYTTNAVREYLRILKPNGVVSLTHWREVYRPTGKRMFVTYLQLLDSLGVKEPWKQVVVVGGLEWTDSILKKTPFTDAELERLRQWTKRTGQVMLFDPGRPGSSEPWYDKMGFASANERPKLIDEFPTHLFAVNDDKPYFYNQIKDENALMTSPWASTPVSLIYATLFGALLLVFGPLLRYDNRKLAGQILPFTVFFAICGFAFLLYETTIIQLFSIFVGGPTYALSVVLVSVLTGYAIGSFLSQYLKINSRTFIVIGLGLCALMIALWLGVPTLTKSLLGLEQPARILICALVTFLSSICTGLPVSLAMNSLRQRYGSAVAWMWAVSSAFNALGGVAFVAITLATGISSCMLIVAALYLIGNLIFAAEVRGK
ncbi:MAG: hypothetical protein KGS72_12200 [Cyanobacteria bacterium REEB67]|nr:hypothetical protein [Cyanobacteria bacterium REEB67]